MQIANTSVSDNLNKHKEEVAKLSYNSPAEGQKTSIKMRIRDT